MFLCLLDENRKFERENKNLIVFLSVAWLRPRSVCYKTANVERGERGKNSNSDDAHLIFNYSYTNRFLDQSIKIIPDFKENKNSCISIKMGNCCSPTRNDMKVNTVTKLYVMLTT